MAITYTTGMERGLSVDQVKERFDRLLEEVLRTTIADITLWISELVPKLTGALQNSLAEKLAMSAIAGDIANIEIGSDLPYAFRVDWIALKAFAVERVNTNIQKFKLFIFGG